MKSGEVIRSNRISRERCYRWRKNDDRRQVSNAKCLRTLEDENRRRNRVVANQAPNFQSVKDVLGKEG